MISSPDASASRSRLADWIEVRALFSSAGAGHADIASLARLTSDDHRDRERDEGGEIVEDEILDAGFEILIDRVSEEIVFREQTLGAEYPFALDVRPFRICLRDITQLTPPHWTYLFLLLMSAQRDRMLPASEKLSSLVGAGRNLFHACASIGVAGLLRNAHTVWFGWPRPDRTGFVQALGALCEKLGCGRAKEPLPPGLPQHSKDDHVDVVGWRAFRDKRNGNLVILCQAATGNDWDDKSVVNHIEAFNDWFEIGPYGRATPCIAIPFPAHHEVAEYPVEGFRIARHNALHRAQKRHGVLIDRLRIVESVFDLNAGACPAGIEGLEKLPEVKEWVSTAVEAIREAAGQ